MSNIQPVDIGRFRVNSHTSMQIYSSLDNDRQQNSNQKKQTKRIPLILKKMNSVQKYVNQFKVTQMFQKKSRPRRQQSPLYNPNLSTSKHLQKIYSQTPEPRLQESQLEQLQNKCYLKYTSTSTHNTGNKLQVLQDIQNQYIKLKQSIHTTSVNQHSYNHSDHYYNYSSINPRTQYVRSQNHRVTLPLRNNHVSSHQQSFVNKKSISILNKKKKGNKIQNQTTPNKINLKDIEKQLKTSVVEENGKKYFADLYLMKRERNKLFREIFGANQKNTNKNKDRPYENTSNQQQFNTSVTQYQGTPDKNGSYPISKTGATIQKSTKSLMHKESLKTFPKLKVNLAQLPTTSYQQKMQAEEHNFVQQKILKDRSQKKQKMLKGRNMNWNVYYQMLALKKNQKDKLKEYCKFSQMYGDD